MLAVCLLLFPTTITAQDDQGLTLAIDSVIAETVDDDSLYADSTFADTLPTAIADSLLSDSVRAAQAEALAAWKAKVREQLANRLNDDLFDYSQVGLMVWDLTDDTLLFAHNERQRMRPASTMKVVTAVSALDRLGTDYQFKTDLYLTGTQRDSTHTWEGKLYLVGGMDPYLEQKDFAVMADSLKALGIDTITGGLYSDYSFKDRKRMGAGWCWDDDDNNPSLVPLTYQGRDNAGSQLRSALRARGIVVEGGSYEGDRPRDARLVCRRERPIATVMRPMLKNSNNKCAESVFYQLAHDEGGKGASAKSASRAIGHTVRKVGLSPDRYDFADGSGLSLYNYCTAELEVQLLRYVFQQKDIFAALYPLLPIAGRDGTLRKRMKGTAAQGNVHAKTGTVTAVSALAGYCTAKNGHVLAFSIINNGLLESSHGRSWQDKVCKILCE